jgi:hypothetical protein
VKSLLRWSLPVLLLVGCSSVFGEPPALDTAIKRYYEAHASEEHGQCLKPYIDGFTKLEVVEDDAQHTVVEARYLYRDRFKSEQSMTRAGGQRVCFGYGERRFVLTKSGDALTVTEMSGPRRG